MSVDKTILRPVVLIVDDERELANELSELLTEAGCVVAVAYDVKAALACIDQRPDITVVLTDVRMPGLDGHQLARILAGIWDLKRRVRVVFMTGHATLDAVVDAMRAEAVDFLQKPLQPAQLIQAVARAHALCVAQREMSAVTSAAPAPAPAREAVLEQSFVAIVSHELRTPLVPIVGLADLLEESCRELGAAHLAHYAAEIAAAGRRLDKLTSRVLVLTALERGVTKPALAEIPLDAIVQRLRKRFADQAAARGQALECVTPVGAHVRTDPELLGMLLEELVDNALKFSPTGEVVRVGAALAGGGVVWWVEDAGVGIPEAALGQAMQAFRQVDMGLNRRHNGLGLGLALVARLAPLLGGQLEVAAGKTAGTRVRVTFPGAAGR